MYGPFENERWIVVEKKSNITLNRNTVSILHPPLSTRSSRRNISFVPNGRKIRREESFPPRHSPKRSSRWIRLILESCLHSRGWIFALGRQMYSSHQRSPHPMGTNSCNEACNGVFMDM